MERINSKKLKPLVKMIGKKVKVLETEPWYGKVLQVLDEETLLVLKNNKPTNVNIYDVRSI